MEIEIELKFIIQNSNFNVDRSNNLIKIIFL